MTVGIDAVSLYTPAYFLDLKCLAQARNVDYRKFYEKLGQYQLAVSPPNEDIVTLAANAAQRVVKHTDLRAIDTLIFATESSIDQAKAAGMYVHQLLGLPENCRVIEVKQACYSGVGAMQLLLPRLFTQPDKKILLIAADIARYRLHTPGESSQGAGAVALLLAAYPRVLALEPASGFFSKEVMDFWRPNYADAAFVEGKYASRMYLQALERTWQQYTAASKRQFDDHQRFCYHNPVPRLVEKAHSALARLNNKHLSQAAIDAHIQDGLQYGRKIGNNYTASFYTSLVSLLDQATDLTDQRIGCYSYGSGCVAEFFSGVVQKNYQAVLDTAFHQQLLQTRQPLHYAEYEQFYTFQLPQDGGYCALPHYASGLFRLDHVQDHKRVYTQVTPAVAGTT